MLLAVGGVLALVVGGCGGVDGQRVAGEPAVEAERQPCKPRRARLGVRHRAAYRAPRQVVTPGEKLTARVQTNCGEFAIALDTAGFPGGANSFVFLARQGFYDGTRFDRAGAGKYLHGGDPPGEAAGPGYRIREEVRPAFIYKHRLVVLEDPGGRAEGSVGSQFFIVVADPWIDRGGDNLPVGSVVEGFGVVDRISRLGPGDPAKPSNLGVVGDVGPLRRPVAIESISVEPGWRAGPPRIGR